MKSVSSSEFEALLGVILLAAAAPWVLRRISPVIRVPIVVGEILGGVAIGRSGLGLLTGTPIIHFLAEFGFIFLMFLSGLEMNFGILFQRAPASGGGRLWRTPSGLAGIYFGLTMLLSLVIGWGLWMAHMARSPVLMALVLSTSSVGIIIPVLKERELTGAPSGQLILAAALLSDFGTLLLLGLVITLMNKGVGLDLFLFVVLLVAFAVAARLGQVLQRVPVLHRWLGELSHATAQIKVRLAFALMLAWVVLAGHLGVEVILGAFLAGAIISHSQRAPDRPFQEKLDAIGYGFFIPIFFIMVGAQLDLRALSGSTKALLLAPVLLVSAYVVKLAPAAVFRVLQPWRKSMAAGALLSSRLSLIIAAAAIAMDLGMIGSGTNSAVILVAIVTCTLSPLLFNRLWPPSRHRERRGVIVLGTDPLAELLGKRLLQGGESVTFIGRDRDRLKVLENLGCRVVFGQPTDEAVLKNAAAEEARALVALSNDPSVVLQVCEMARDRFEIPSVVARADNPDRVRQLQEGNVQVVQPAMAMALGLEGALRFPGAFSRLTNRSEEFDLMDVPLLNPSLMERPLRQLQFPGRAIVLGVRRQGEDEIVIPHADTVFRAGDVITLVGDSEALREARALLQSG